MPASPLHTAACMESKMGSGCNPLVCLQVSIAGVVWYRQSHLVAIANPIVQKMVSR